jgi:N-methylhydantoinase A
MISALKLVSVRRGYDPRDFVLVAAGGGGPMHAAALGAELQVKRVVVPPHSGVFSAWGMGLSEPRADAAQTRILALAGSDAEELGAVFDVLEREVVTTLVGDGARPPSIRCERTADMRYRGQEHAVRVPIPPGAVSAAAVEADFHALHRQKYTFDLEGDPVEIVTCHVAGFGSRPPLPSPFLAGARPGSSPTPKGHRRVDFDADGVHEAAVYDRAALPVGFRASGPLVVEDETTTALVHPGQTLEVDEAANLRIQLH